MLAAAVWVGGLLSLFVTIRATHRSASETEALTQALRRFSVVGFIAVLFILGSGLLNSWFLVASPGALLHSAYGRTLVIKVSFFLCMIALALFNRLYIMPRLDRRAEAPQIARLLLRSVAVEQAFAVLVVAGVSVLGTLPPAMDMAGM
jgi:putative copper resistance protein D